MVSPEFYICFWEDIGSCLVSTLNYSFEHGELTSSQKQAVITLIEKKGRDKRLVKNWRPISLINVDIKIASKSLAMRAKIVISHLVNCDQTAYVKGRNIGERIRLIDDLMNYAEQENLDGLIFAADIEKAFDSVDHKFIFASLEKYGFGPNFIQWIKTLLANNESCVMNNGSSTGFFKIQRGTKQGDPLSPYSFILVLEILFIQIRNDKAIRGFKIGDIEIRMTAFADDSTFFVRDKQSNLKYYENFWHILLMPALKNVRCIEKCEVCWIGQPRFRKDMPVNCKLTSLVTSSIKILGVHFSYDKEIADDKKFSDLLNCMR